MVIFTLLGGFALWLVVRPLLPAKHGIGAIACFTACFIAAFAFELWLCQDLYGAIVARIHEIWSRFAIVAGGAVCYHERMALFTGKGDGGTTKLFDSEPGKRASKASPIFETLGMLDELNTLVGWCKAGSPDDFMVLEQKLRLVLHDVQNHLFTLQAEVAGAQKSIPLSSVEALGVLINRIEAEMPPIKTFLVPGATELSSRLDIARAVARRAERRLVTLHESGERAISEPGRAYANRLSSLLYALTRLVNHREGVVENPPAYLS